MYADDSTITVTGETIRVLEDKLQNDVENKCDEDEGDANYY